MGFLGLKSTLIPWQIVSVNEEGRSIQLSMDKARAKDGPAFDDDREITPEYENEVRSYYGIQNTQGSEEQGAYGDEADDSSGEVGPGMRMGDTESGEFREHGREQEGVNQPGDDLEDEDELRVQRSEEELRAGTREREAGSLNVRKRVRTDREQVRVPVKHEEVNVERVPVNEEASGAEIGEDEVSVPVVEEEVVTDKRAVVKEELRIRKDVVEDEEVVEEDVRKEEVDVDDETTGRRDR